MFRQIYHRNIIHRLRVDKYQLLIRSYYHIFAQMNKEQINKAEESLREIAQKSGTSIKNIYALVTQAYIDDARYQEKINHLRNIEIQYEQLKLMRVQTANELIQNELLSFKLKRKVWIRRKLGFIKPQKP